MAKAQRGGAATASVVAGPPSGKWAQVLTETRAKGKAIDPFDLTGDDGNLVARLYPPTPRRSKAMSRATMACQAALKAATNAVQNGAEPGEVDEIRDAIEAADDAYTKGLVGDEQYPAVEAYFEDRAEWEREAFYDVLKTQFLRLPSEEDMDRVEQLEAQVTSLLEALHETNPEHRLIAEIAGELPGKANGSSTTSSTTGMTSRPTSPSDSTESGPETGATNGRGESSSTTATLSLA